MTPNAAVERIKPVEHARPANASQQVDREHWAERARLLWRYRSRLLRVGVIAFLVSLGLVLLMPKQYTAGTSIMPPAQSNTNALMLAALASHSSALGSMGSLASGLLGGQSSTALFIDLLRSGTVTGHLIDRFNLQHVYHKKYRVDTAKRLSRLTKISEDKKSGVITIEVEDESPVRARDIAQGYLDELNNLVTATNNSAAHQERVFIEQRLHSVQADLESAQLALSAYSTKNGTIDITDQMRAEVEGGSRVQSELLLQQSLLQSLRQMYGDDNVRVREAQARIASLQQGLNKIAGGMPAANAGAGHNPNGAAHPSPNAAANAGAGGGADLNANPAGGLDPLGSAPDPNQLYPPLRQIPALAVPYADLYRHVKVEEAAFELLTQQYEMARIEEARDVPAVHVIDAPGVPEKRSGPQRRLIVLALTFLSLAIAAGWILFREHWEQIDGDDPRKTLAAEVLPVVHARLKQLTFFRRSGPAEQGGGA
jgi:capsule polysaccharide export protein KpsE/RkpR